MNVTKWITKIRPCVRPGRIAVTLLAVLVSGGVLFYAWWAIFFFPDDYFLSMSEAREKPGGDNRQRIIGLSLLETAGTMKPEGDFSVDRISKYINGLIGEGYLVKKESLMESSMKRLLFRVGTGLPGIWVDERTSVLLLPGNALSCPVNPDAGARLELSLLSPRSRGRLSVQVLEGGKVVLEKKVYAPAYRPPYTPEDVRMKWNNRGFEKARADLGWREFGLDLGQFSGRAIHLRFSASSEGGGLFLGNPRVFRASTGRRYNVIYLLFDGVATRYWSFHNRNSDLTPKMARVLEREFLIFDNMYSLGNKTRISTAGLFTSVLPHKTRHGINRNFIPEEQKDLFYELVRKGRFTSLPDLFRKKGYVSEQFGNSGFTVHLISTGIDYGFDRSYEFSYNPYDTYGISHRFFTFLRENRNREFFTYLHYNTPHKPFYAPIHYFGRGLRQGPLEGLWRPDFLGCIQYTDDVFDTIYEALRTNGLLEKSIIVVATDHGSGYDPEKFDGGFLYNDYTRLTFAVRLPRELMREMNITPHRIRTNISAVNIAPTLADLAGLHGPTAFEGRSFRSLLADRKPPAFFDREIWCFGRKDSALLTPDSYKYILTGIDTGPFVSKKYIFFGPARQLPLEHVYNTASDPLERMNLVHLRSDRLREFRKLVNERDMHHPERMVLSFFPASKGKSLVEIRASALSPVVEARLYDGSMKDAGTELKASVSGTNHRYRFTVEKGIRHFTFETENDRVPLRMEILENGRPVARERIFASSMNLNCLDNPFLLGGRDDFLALYDHRIQGPADLPETGGLRVRVARMDLHRWVDAGESEERNITAGMKETLKSWGYIQ